MRLRAGEEGSAGFGPSRPSGRKSGAEITARVAGLGSKWKGPSPSRERPGKTEGKRTRARRLLRDSQCAGQEAFPREAGEASEAACDVAGSHGASQSSPPHGSAQA